MRLRVEVVGRPDVGLIIDHPTTHPQVAEREWNILLNAMQRQLENNARTNPMLRDVTLCVTECIGPDGKLRRARNGEIPYANRISLDRTGSYVIEGLRFS